MQTVVAWNNWGILYQIRTGGWPTLKPVLLLLPSLNEEQNSTCSGCWKCTLSWHASFKAAVSWLCLLLSFSGKTIEVRWLLSITFYNSNLSLESTQVQPNVQWLHWNSPSSACSTGSRKSLDLLDCLEHILPLFQLNCQYILFEGTNIWG